jgi:hypothetical protein
MLIVIPYQMVQLGSWLIGHRVLCQKPLLKYFVLLHEDLITVSHKNPCVVDIFISM